MKWSELEELAERNGWLLEESPGRVMRTIYLYTLPDNLDVFVAAEGPRCKRLLCRAVEKIRDAR